MHTRKDHHLRARKQDNANIARLACNDMHELLLHATLINTFLADKNHLYISSS